MGAAFYIVLDNEEPGFDPFVNGKFLSNDSENLETISRALGVKALYDFCSESIENARAFLESEGAVLDGAEFPEEVWFDADEGLQWVEKIKGYIEENRTAVANPDGVLFDLREYQDVLRKAKALGARWHLSVDY